MTKWCFALLIVAVSLVGCRKTQQKPVEESPETLYRVDHTPPPAPNKFLHKSFKLTNYAKFEFEVPAHIAAPRLQGTFTSSIPGQSSDGFSDTGNIDMLIMKPEEFDEFAHGRGGAPSYSITGVHSQDVDYLLPSTAESPQKYYLVFQNPSPKGPPKSVDAEFTASF